MKQIQSIIEDSPSQFEARILVSQSCPFCGGTGVKYKSSSQLVPFSSAVIPKAVTCDKCAGNGIISY